MSIATIASSGGDDRPALAVGRVAVGDDGGGLDAAGAVAARRFVAVVALLAVAPLGCVVALSVLVPFLREKFGIWTAARTDEHKAISARLSATGWACELALAVRDCASEPE